MAIKLREAGIHNFTILEKADRLGGTWRDNTYPGCGCDVPSFLYCYSFEQKTDWSRRFAGHAEILEYLEECARKHEILPHIQFNTAVAASSFDEEAGVWKIKSEDGREFEAEFLVSGVGQLNRPFTPNIPGLEEFSGKQFHSARWDHDYDLKGKNVAVVGNGASALQFIPPISHEVGKMTVYQRSANWISPKPDGPYSDFQLNLFSRIPLLAKLYRLMIYALLEMRWPVFSKGSRLGKMFEKQTTDAIADNIPDPELRAALTPDYPVGCKRILLASDYFEALARDNVEVATSHINRIENGAVVTEDGNSTPVDTIIFATGFETTGFLVPMDIRGVGGQSLAEKWKQGAEAYYGVAVSGFPNFFVLYGPNTNLGHNSIVIMIESQVAYIVNCMEAVLRRGGRSIDVRQDVEDRYNEQIQKRLDGTVWSTSCDSWYKNDAGRIVNNWAYGTLKYMRQMRHLDPDAFEFKK